MSTVGRRYARAAVDVARDKGGSALDELSRGLGAFLAAYDASSDLREVLANPALKDERVKVLAAIAAKLHLSELATRTIQLLAERDRIIVLRDVAHEVEALADEQIGRLRAKVQSAMPLTESQTARLATALEKRLGRPVVVTVALEPALLGGLHVQVGDVTLDSTLKRQLELWRERLESVG